MFQTRPNGPIDPGAMREIVHIQTRTTTVNSIGEPVTSAWVDIADPLRYAGVQQTSSSETVTGEGIVTSFGANFFLRSPLASVEPGNCRVVYRDNIYHVSGVDRNSFRNHLVVLSAFRQDNQPPETLPAVSGVPGTGGTTQVGEGPPVGGDA
jgi:head-tail adaptor